MLVPVRNSATVFTRIALSLSGGGYRAAAFHLGVLSFLDRIGILGNVRALSTASGGTIVGAYYAQCVAARLPFTNFYENFFAFLRDTDVIDAALRRMTASGAGRPATLITAAAEVYADRLFDSTLGMLQASSDHLEEIAFNATDMHRGLAFRFVKTANRLVRSGNRETPLPPDVAAGVRLADVVAASSCFPAAFEPIMFPRDFAGLTADDIPAVPLMDGGIYDNQGVDSLMLVRARRRREIDTILISDADANVPPLYREPEAPAPGVVRVGWMAAALLGLALAALVSSVILAIEWQWRLLLPLVVCLTTVVAVTAAAISLCRVTRTRIADRPWPLLWRHIWRLTLRELRHAVELRGMSLVALTARVFMKRVRTLTYQRVFERPSTTSRAVGNLIADLDRDDVPPAMRAMAIGAASVPTTLWLENESQIRDLVAVGEMTTCRNLLRRIKRAKDTPSDETLRVRHACEREWAEFCRIVEARQ